MSDKTQAAESAVEQHLNDTYGDADEVSEASLVVTAHHKPGEPLERAGDAEQARAREAEEVADTEPNAHVVEYEQGGVDSRTPEANLASRSNIVSDGPGTVGAA